MITCVASQKFESSTARIGPIVSPPFCRCRLCAMISVVNPITDATIPPIPRLVSHSSSRHTPTPAQPTSTAEEYRSRHRRPAVDVHACADPQRVYQQRQAQDRHHPQPHRPAPRTALAAPEVQRRHRQHEREHVQLDAKQERHRPVERDLKPGAADLRDPRLLDKHLAPIQRITERAGLVGPERSHHLDPVRLVRLAVGRYALGQPPTDATAKAPPPA